MSLGSSPHAAHSGIRYGLWFILIALQGMLLPSQAQAGSDSLMINVVAEVVNQACSLRPGDETITVNFGNIVNKELLRDKRTPSKEFQLHLEECDPDISKGVKVTFSGKGAPEDPDLLALMGDSTAKGIAIGLEHQGKALPLNKVSRELMLTAGDNVLTFATYVQLLPSGQAGLVPGTFSASANFKLEYE
ncbi:fimbrial protein [Aeromonas hydrophila]|uniref:fimbrial protein n=1 Tax=Aeromonas hydrophila TaxID=644 RepID=UPI003EC81A32